MGTLKKMLTVVMALLLCLSMMPVNTWAIAEEAQPKDLEIVNKTTDADEPASESAEVEQPADELTLESVSESDTVETAEGELAAEELAVEPVVESTPDEELVEPTEESKDASAPDAESTEPAEETEEAAETKTTEAIAIVEEQSAEPAIELKDEPAAEPIAKPEEPTTEESATTFPAFIESNTVSGVKVSVEAEEGVFPEGATLSVKKISRNEQKRVDRAIGPVRDGDANVAASYTFDIKILDHAGKEVQPKDNAKVKVFFELAEADNDNLDTQVYHISEKSFTPDAVEALKAKTIGETVMVETDGFSYYTVEFTYNNLEYVLQGGESVALSEVLDAVGLSGEVSSASVSDEILFTVEKENGIWVIKSHKAFSTTEWMKVTIEGIEYEIVVTDEQFPDSGTIDGTNSPYDLIGGGTYADGNLNITKGPVRGPQGSTATIKNYYISNKAANTNGGGFNNVGSAFLVRGANSIVFDTVTIDSSHKNSAIFNIWQNSSMEAINVIINGTNFGGEPFLIVGSNSGMMGTLNFSGTNVIKNMTNTSIRGGNNNSVINVNSGTLTIENSSFSINNGIKLIVKSGASLIVKGTTELSGTKPTIKSGATLDLTSCGKYTIDNVGGSFNFEDGATVKVNEYTINEIIVNNGETATISMDGGKEVITKEPSLSGSVVINGKTVNVTAESVTVAEKAPITVKSGGELTFDEVTLEGRDNITIESGGKAYLKGPNTFTNCTISNSGSIYVEGTSAAIINSSLTFTGNSGVIVVEAGKTLAVDPTKLTPTGKQQVQVYGTFILEETEVDLSKNGAIRWIRIEDGGTVNITNSELSGSTSLGVVRANARSTLNIEGSTFKNNKATGGGEQNNGGVILAWNSDITINESTFADNNSRGHGGALYLNSCTTSINASEFTGNVAEDGLWAHGGAICALGGGELTIDGGSRFAGNKSHLGAAVIILNGTTAYVNKAIFEENEVTNAGGYYNDGGALFVSEGGTLYIPNVAIHDNNARNGGSGLYVCGNGTAKVMSGAAAIYDNEGGDFMQRHYNGGTQTQVFDEALGGGQHNWTWTESGDGNNVLYATSDLASRPADGGEKAKPMLFSAASGGDAKADVVLRNNKSNGTGAGLGANGTVVIGDRTQIRIYKVWVDNSDAAGKRIVDEDFVKRLKVTGSGDVGEIDLTADGIDVKVHKSGEFKAYTDEIEAAKKGRIDETVTATDDNWVIDITGLPKEGWPYSVYESESGRPGEAVSEYYLPPFSTDPETDRELGFTGFKNTYAEGKATIKGTKTLKGRDIKEGEFEFILEKVTKTETGEETEEVGRATCDADGKFSFELTYTLKEYLASLPLKEYAYYITEAMGEDKSIDYDTHKEEVTVKLNYAPYGSTEIDTEVVYDEDEKMEFVNEAYTEITIIKAWDDEDDKSGKRPSHIEAKLWGNDKLVETVMLNEENEWKYTFNKLPLQDDKKRDITYVVTEETVDGYETPIIEKTSVDRVVTYTITNKVKEEIVETTSIPVTKIWDDLNNLEGRRGNVTINLLANGKKVDSLTLTAKDVGDKPDEWKGEFKDLPVKDDEGKKITYTVEEEIINWHMVEISGSADKGFDITNISRPWIPEVPSTSGEEKYGSFTLKKTVSGIAEEDKIYEVEVLFTHSDGTTKTQTYKLTPNEILTFDYVVAGTKVKVTEKVTGYTVTYTVDGEECQEFTIADGDSKEVVVNNDKTEEKTPDEPKKEEKKSSNPKTGDESNILGYILLLTLAVETSLVLYRRRRAK